MSVIFQQPHIQSYKIFLTAYSVILSMVAYNIILYHSRWCTILYHTTNAVIFHHTLSVKFCVVIFHHSPSPTSYDIICVRGPLPSALTRSALEPGERPGCISVMPRTYMMYRCVLEPLESGHRLLGVKWISVPTLTKLGN